jgi:hypothetical protein
MIDKALFFLKEELNAYLKLKTGDSDKVSLTAVVDQSGHELVPAKSIGLMLVNIQEERAYSHPNPQTLSNGHYSFKNRELSLNLYIVAFANHTDHREALILISHVVQFFQGTNVFEAQEFPQLGEDIEKLIVDLYTLTFEQQNQLWASLGAKYLPSAVYKIRMLIIDSNQPGAVSPGITSLDSAFANNRE